MYGCFHAFALCYVVMCWLGVLLLNLGYVCCGGVMVTLTFLFWGLICLLAGDQGLCCFLWVVYLGSFWFGIGVHRFCGCYILWSDVFGCLRLGFVFVVLGCCDVSLAAAGDLMLVVVGGFFLECCRFGLVLAAFGDWLLCTCRLWVWFCYG